MSESEIRRVLREVCEDLDRRARRVRRVVLPAVLGAGVALSGGCGHRQVPTSADGGAGDQSARTAEAAAPYADGGLLPPSPGLYSAPTPLPPRDARSLQPDVGAPKGAYGVPFPKPKLDAAAQADVGDPQLDYMAPEPLYAAPGPTPTPTPKPDV